MPRHDHIVREWNNCEKLPFRKPIIHQSICTADLPETPHPPEMADQSSTDSGLVRQRGATPALKLASRCSRGEISLRLQHAAAQERAHLMP